MPPPERWPQADGTPVACREKLKTLAENHAELAQVMQDAFEDAVLMGVDEQAMRDILAGMVRSLRSPLRAAALLLAVLAAAAPAAAAPTPGAPPAAAPAPTPPVPTPPGADVWLPRPIVELSGLDKVSARATLLTGPVGQAMHFGTLTVLPRACVVRPPDVAADAAAFLEISDTQLETRPFRAWMLVSVPAVSIFEHPVYDIRLVGCRAAP